MSASEALSAIRSARKECSSWLPSRDKLCPRQSAISGHTFEDDILDPQEGLIGRPDTERVFQEWASTRYAFTSLTGFVTSLAYNGPYRIQANTRLEFMPEWIERRYLPILIRVDSLREKVLTLSEQAIGEHIRHSLYKQILDMRRRLYPYAITHDTQDERIWNEVKRARRLDEVFERVNQQFQDYALWWYQQLPYFLIKYEHPPCV